MHLTPNMYKFITLKTNAKEIVSVKMHLTPNMYKFITLKANAQKIMSLQNAFDTKHVQNRYFARKC